ncbi:MAG: RsmB/NOP family class I SAM-dependent RNA methyltransferase [Candidatus Thorarchaeota archaeon]|nr:RsmB/NOP family class I SAM-dependent RNA methyltransferase [Candidatus Thorarchaeota archaeon]
MSIKEHRQKAKDLAKEYGYLPYMIERYLALWGQDETLEFLKACERPIRTSIRTNTLKITVQELKERLEKKNVSLEGVPWMRESLWADFRNGSPGAFFEHMLGFYYVQNVPSMTASAVLDPKPGETVVDLAAAPGGKTTHLAQLMENTGMIFAIEYDRNRIASLEANIQRCGVTNTIVMRGDAKKLDELRIEPDKIMLDAPCSGEGLIPLDSNRKTSKSMADIRFCATREGNMLDAAVRSLAPGGTMVYSTCSIAPEENEYVVDDILRRYSEINIVPTDLDFGISGYTEPYGVHLDKSLSLARRFLPHLHDFEGFFICRLRKDT